MVMLIDDYDFSTSVLKSNAKEYESARSAILQFYLILKSTEGSFRFQMLAGDKSYYPSGYMEMFGDFNNMNDISADADYAALGGFTEEEIRRCFKPSLDAAAKRLRISDYELMALMRERFGGYSFEEPDFFTSIEKPEVRALLSCRSRPFPRRTSQGVKCPGAMRCSKRLPPGPTASSPIRRLPASCRETNRTKVSRRYGHQPGPSCPPTWTRGPGTRLSAPAPLG